MSYRPVDDGSSARSHPQHHPAAAAHQDGYIANLDDSSIPGSCRSLYLTILAISLFLCLGRTDFNMPIYLMGYFIWATGESSKAGTLWRSIVQLNWVLTGLLVLDGIWVTVAMLSWFCDACVLDLKLRWEEGLHHFVLYASCLNWVGKAVVMFLQSMWVQMRRGVVRQVGVAGGMGMAAVAEGAAAGHMRYSTVDTALTADMASARMH
ncbi:unnamed protein product [Vitrella brassicaformis CCMP3155]|uniref:Uncharacterized protein n=2 Tax=Vitrella brassicaformis TaxID=1169539 RepID=A0A0G4EWU1_VITBC|nr:unnamed protein product [Vitrella brassicaformis CCMP3155]|eukprot:CEM03452.1 unnamed protein product [Vitrella brassicaformis CCMP3155]